jgi:hypothetical protein
MRFGRTITVILCVALPFSVVAGQTSETKREDCVAQKAEGWPLPWSTMKYSASKRTVLLYNDKPTELHRQLLTFPRETAIPVPGCNAIHLLQTSGVTRVDFQGHVFAYLVSGTSVHRDETGHLRDLGSVTFAMWYDDIGDGRFRKVIGTPPLPPAIPAWVYRGSDHPK